MSGINQWSNFKGRPVHGWVTSTDASGNVPFTLQKPGTTTSDSVGTDERLLITDYHLISVPGGACAIYAAATSANQYVVAAGTVAANGGFAGSKLTPVFGKKGEAPSLVAPAGQVNAVIEGLIIKAGD